MSDFVEFYREIIQFHNDYPMDYTEKDCDHVTEAYNPFCGDQYHLCIEMKEGRFVSHSFYGHGCALSKASTSILMKNLDRWSVDEFLEQYDHFFNLLRSDPEQEFPVEVEELKAFEGVRRNPGRLTCATLSWKALADMIRN